MSADSLLPSELLDHAAAPYRAAGLVPYLFARGKLRGDPAFASLLRLGLIPPNARLLDLGCGQGLLAALLRAAVAPAAAASWPGDWAQPPRSVRVHGIELAQREVRWARCLTRSGTDESSVSFEQADVRSASFGAADVVVLLDVLHYLAPTEQQLLLARVRDCLTPGGVLLLRVADANAGFGFVWSVLIDKLVLAARGSRRLRLHCRPLGQWREMLLALGFTVRIVPMHAGTLFANLLLVCQLARH